MPSSSARKPGLPGQMIDSGNGVRGKHTGMEEVSKGTLTITGKNPLMAKNRTNRERKVAEDFP